jgi:hypothetical protein
MLKFMIGPAISETERDGIWGSNFILTRGFLFQPHGFFLRRQKSNGNESNVRRRSTVHCHVYFKHVIELDLLLHEHHSLNDQ